MPYKNKEDNKEWARKRRRKVRELITKLKEDRGARCEKCGYDDFIHALHFHHPGEKKFKINLKASTRSDEAIRIEVSNCELICANCHIKEHSDDWYAGRNQYNGGVR